MENIKHPELGRLLRSAVMGRTAMFAMEYSEGEADILASCDLTSDSRARLIYRLFKEYNEDQEEDDAEILDTDLDFSALPEDKAVPIGSIKTDLIPDDKLGTMTIWYVRLSAEDADFLLGVLPDSVIHATVERYLDTEGSY